MSVTSLIGSIVDYYANGSSTDLTTLRTDLGTGKFWGDVVPDTVERPFVVLSEEATHLVQQTVKVVGNKNNRVVDVIVAFDVYAISRPQAETILDDLENAFIDVDLTSSSQWSFGRLLFEDRSQHFDGEAWMGTLTVSVRKTKSAS